jgi:hypothetical protein
MLNLGTLAVGVTKIQPLAVTPQNSTVLQQRVRTLFDAIPTSSRGLIRQGLPSTALFNIASLLEKKEVDCLTSNTNPTRWQQLLAVAFYPTMKGINSLSEKTLAPVLHHGLQKEESFILGLLEAQAKRASTQNGRNNTAPIRLRDIETNPNTQRFTALLYYKRELLQQLRTQLYDTNKSSKIINQLDAAIEELSNPILFDPKKPILDISS